ncbi:alpha/beta-hydrolase [Byssothecium circinans]|uniref:Alpha/beta-hydrolase n=1 Tax=Byssothecium circinans TaxID=147558 RepID=A0A6A5U959_9PLEO|nr:alpha/beta-hydrolase [Byssothecium circinans]
MTIVCTDQERRRRKKTSAPKAQAANPNHNSGIFQASQSSLHVRQQPYAHPTPNPAVATQEHHAHTTSPPPLYSSPAPPPQEQHHPIYGPSPRMPQQYSQPYHSPPNQPVQPYVGGLTVTITPPAKQNSGYLRANWNRAERMASKSCESLSNQIASGASKGATKMATNLIVKPTTLATNKSVQALNQGAALCDRISDKFDAVLTSIDGGLFSGNEQDLYVYEDQPQNPSISTFQTNTTQERGINFQSRPTLTSSKGSNFFSKVWLYSNSRLPPHLPPFKVYIPTFPLICLAATYSERAYDNPNPPQSKSETEIHVPADWRSGTKAMVLKSLPVDDMNTIVFAVRGTQTFMDWAVNYRGEPASPEGFLDDAGNYCHQGFLQVARKMVKPVADRLRVLLEENPARSNASLLITGHSAGGAVAALLFAHMMNVEVQSDLSFLTGFFKRVHCVTFGAPPTSLLPLKKPKDPRHRKSLFYSFINEGDPVPRMDKSVFKSLLKLYSSPAPTPGSSSNTLQTASTFPSSSTRPRGRFATCKPSKSSLKTASSAVTAASLPAYPIAQCSLCPAGRLVVLRNKPGSPSGPGGDDNIEAVTVEDEVLRSVVYGDPEKHVMLSYKKRVEYLATKAVTGAEW